MRFFIIIHLLILSVLVTGAGRTANDPSKVIIRSGFIFNAGDVPFPSCHASTIEETPHGLVAAWFGGTHEKNKDVCIWLSRLVNGKWTKPVEAANGILNDSVRYPTWNPVLFSLGNELLLFYKVGPSPSTWWGEMKTSQDFGLSWSPTIRLPEGIFGPVKNKPVLLPGGKLLCPSSTEDKGWRVHMEWTTDGGKTWQRTGALNSGDTLPAIQPTLLFHARNRIQLLCRTKKDRIYTAWSSNQGETWTPLTPVDLPNNNSGIDGVTLKDGRHLLVYNPADQTHDKGARNRLNLAVSDDGIHWKVAAILENDENRKSEYSYPAIILTSDGLVHITYTWKRELIRHVVIDPAQL
jgi:predicted neuraminidase